MDYFSCVYAEIIETYGNINVGCNCIVTHTFKYKRPGDNLFWLLAAISLLVLSFYLLTKIILQDNLNWKTLLLPTIFCSIAIMLLRVLQLRRQYHQVDNDKTVKIDSLKHEFCITQFGTQMVLTNNDIKKAEISSSWNTNPLFSRLSYTVLTLVNDDKVIITYFTADAIDIQPMLTGKQVKRTTKLMNPIR